MVYVLKSNAAAYNLIWYIVQCTCRFRTISHKFVIFMNAALNVTKYLFCLYPHSCLSRLRIHLRVRWRTHDTHYPGLRCICVLTLCSQGTVTKKCSMLWTSHVWKSVNVLLKTFTELIQNGIHCIVYTICKPSAFLVKTASQFTHLPAMTLRTSYAQASRSHHCF